MKKMHGYESAVLHRLLLERQSLPQPVEAYIN